MSQMGFNLPAAFLQKYKNWEVGLGQKGGRSLTRVQLDYTHTSCFSFLKAVLQLYVFLFVFWLRVFIGIVGIN